MQRSKNSLPLLCLPCNGIDKRRRADATGAPVRDTAVESLPPRDQAEIEAQGICAICLGELVEYDEDTGEIVHMYTLFKLDHTTPANPSAVSHWYHQTCLARYVRYNALATCPVSRQEISDADLSILMQVPDEEDEEEEYDDDDQEEDDDDDDGSLANMFAAAMPGGPAAAGPAAAGPAAGPAAAGPSAAGRGGRRPRAARPKPARPKRHKPTCSFLCISVRQLGFTTRNGRPIAPGIPCVLLMGHLQKTGRRRWGFPGGQRERGRDRTTLENAVREFAEEFLGMVRPDRRTIRYIIDLLKKEGTLKLAVDTNASGYSAWSIVFRTAKHFEDTLKKIRGANTGFVGRTVEQKYNYQFSRHQRHPETKGYVWSPLAPHPVLQGQWVLPTRTERIQHRNKRIERYRTVLPPIPNVDPLRLRAGTVGPALQRTLSLL